MRMRTTLTIEDDALALARALSRRKHVSLGRAVSELVRRGALQPVSTVERHGLEVVQLPRAAARVTAARVDQLTEELP